MNLPFFFFDACNSVIRRGVVIVVSLHTLIQVLG